MDMARMTVLQLLGRMVGIEIEIVVIVVVTLCLFLTLCRDMEMGKAPMTLILLLICQIDSIVRVDFFRRGILLLTNSRIW